MLQAAELVGSAAVWETSEFYKLCVKAGLEFPSKEGGWVLIPRWIIKAAMDFDDGYAGMDLGEYLSRLVGEQDD